MVFLKNNYFLNFPITFFVNFNFIHGDMMRKHRKKDLKKIVNYRKRNFKDNSLLNKELQDSLNLGDTKSLPKLLKELIEQTYKVEKEFKDFKGLIELVLEMIPQAVIVFNENGSLFYRNKKASNLKGILDLDFTNQEFEIKIDNNVYLFQSANISHKRIITATNITEQKRQARLTSMGQVSAHLAHEIRNPIASISLFTSALSKRVDKESLEIVEEMKKSIWRVERIIKSTLLFSKGVQANISICNISEIQKSINQVINEYTYTKNIKFEINLNVKSIKIDFSLFEIALHNLLCNAIDAIEDGNLDEGKIIISLNTEKDFDVLRIYDNGREIEDISSLFEAFKTTKLKGHGLGLALSLQIINAHNGFLSASDNKEKYFEIKIPH